MALPGWRELTIRAVAEYTGPVAELLVDDALSGLGINEADMNAGLYIRFLERLYAELPTDIDRNLACQTVRKIVLSKYGL